jgi:class 3 adenylate cyclase
VLFADVKGSMELLADRDPEEARKLLDPVLEHMIEAVHRYEGTVNQVMGDGIMALFGAPIAHEDHAVRACYAAIDMQGALRRFAEEVQRSQGIRVAIRAGLHSGDVVVRAIGSDLHMDYTAVGQTTHLAARMEHASSLSVGPRRGRGGCWAKSPWSPIHRTTRRPRRHTKRRSRWRPTYVCARSSPTAISGSGHCTAELSIM